MGATSTKVRDSIEPRASIRSRRQHLPKVVIGSDYDYWEAVRRELAQNRPGAHGHLASDKSDHGGASAANVLREIVENLLPMGEATGCKIELELIEHGTARALGTDLRSAIRALLESSLAQGSHQVQVVLRLDDSASGRQIILIEVLSDALEVPDAVRRKLSKAVIAHAGETTFISARTGSCVRIRIPKVVVPPKSANCRASDEYEIGLTCDAAASSDNLPSGPNSEPSWPASEIPEYVPRL